jgi:hypothetical protein
MSHHLNVKEHIEASEKGSTIHQDRADSSRNRGSFLLAVSGALWFVADKLFDAANAAPVEKVDGLLRAIGGFAAFGGTVTLGVAVHNLHYASAESRTAERMMLEATIMEYSPQAMAQPPSATVNR